MSISEFLIEPHQIPAMPHIIVKALSIIKDEDAGMKDIAKIISYDQALCTQILTLANSAYYSFQQQILTIEHAIPLIGLKQVKNLVMSVGMKSMLTNAGGKTLWEHSIRCGVAAEYIAKEQKLMNPDDAFMVGFLHDIGKILLYKKSPVMYTKVEELINRGLDSLEAEQIFFKINHTEVGFFLASKWKLSIIIANAIKYHHDPLKSSMVNVATLIYYADKLVTNMHKRVAFDPIVEEKTNIRIPNPEAYREEIMDRSGVLLAQLIN